jgi:hypothetical protein
MATTSPTTQPANPPPNQPQAANSTSSTFPLQSPLPHLPPQHHLQNTPAVAANTPAAPANTSLKAAHSPPRKSNAHVPIVLTRPAQSRASNTTHPRSTASPAASARLKSSQTVKAKATVIPTLMYLLSRHLAVHAAVAPPRLHLPVHLRDRRQRVAVLAIASASRGLELGSSLIAAVRFVVMRGVSVLLRARMRKSIVRGLRDGRAWLCVVETATLEAFRCVQFCL